MLSKEEFVKEAYQDELKKQTLFQEKLKEDLKLKEMEGGLVRDKLNELIQETKAKADTSNLMHLRTRRKIFESNYKYRYKEYYIYPETDHSIYAEDFRKECHDSKTAREIYKSRRLTNWAKYHKDAAIFTADLGDDSHFPSQDARLTRFLNTLSAEDREKVLIDCAICIVKDAATAIFIKPGNVVVGDSIGGADQYAKELPPTRNKEDKSLFVWKMKNPLDDKEQQERVTKAANYLIANKFDPNDVKENVKRIGFDIENIGTANNRKGTSIESASQSSNSSSSSSGPPCSIT